MSFEGALTLRGLGFIEYNFPLIFQISFVLIGFSLCFLLLFENYIIWGCRIRRSFIMRSFVCSLV